MAKTAKREKCDCGRNVYEKSVFCKMCMKEVMKQNEQIGVTYGVQSLRKRWGYRKIGTGPNALFM